MGDPAAMELEEYERLPVRVVTARERASLPFHLVGCPALEPVGLAWFRTGCAFGELAARYVDPPRAEPHVFGPIYRGTVEVRRLVVQDA